MENRAFIENLETGSETVIFNFELPHQKYHFWEMGKIVTVTKNAC